MKTFFCKIPSLPHLDSNWAWESWWYIEAMVDGTGSTIRCMNDDPYTGCVTNITEGVISTGWRGDATVCLQIHNQGKTWKISVLTLWNVLSFLEKTRIKIFLVNTFEIKYKDIFFQNHLNNSISKMTDHMFIITWFLTHRNTNLKRLLKCNSSKYY